MMGESRIMDDQQKSVLKLKLESGAESVHYPLTYESMPEEFKRIAEKEINETEENIRKGLQRLKDFMNRENIAFLEDYILLAILRNCKFNLKKSETKLKSFHQKRREIIKMLVEIDTNKIQNIIDDFCFGFLPYRDKHGRAIFYTRPCGLNLEKYEIHDVAVITVVATFFTLKYPITTVSGYVYFGQCKSSSLYIFYPIFRACKQLMFHAFSCPARIAAIEMLNENYLIRGFIKVLSPLISKKVVSRISVHGMGYDNLHKFYHPNILPEEFGGNMGPLSNEAYKQKLLDFVEELKNEIV